MNKQFIPKKHADKEHGTVKNYVTGFLLSLILTSIPYYLVVSETLSGKTLLSLILSFAVMQMLVQIFFFLHLGRGPKPFYNIFFLTFNAFIIVTVIAGSIFIMDRLHYNMNPTEVTKNLAEAESIAEVGGKKTGACEKLGANHQVLISNGTLSPLKTTAKLCDTLTFISQESTTREMTFGRHPQHGEYGGVAEFQLRKGKNNTITLNKTGIFYFHDHLDPNIAGQFTVKL